MNGKQAGKRMSNGDVSTAPGARTRNPAVGYLDFALPNVGLEAKPLAPEAQNIGSAGLGREYLPMAEDVRGRDPREVTLQYGGGYVSTAASTPNGFVDRSKLLDGLHYIWTDEFDEMPLNAMPAELNGVPRDSEYGRFLHFKQRLAMNGGWWSVVRGISQNTGFVAQTRPDPLSGPNQSAGQPFTAGTHTVQWGVPGIVLEVPRPSTKPKTVAAISVMTP